ncbi:YcxB family protein [Bacillus weihaiensis]|uniref:YcxB family protein n=1 Tax=Bacillus weihaiensis TaxID=1547283 RepID=UPI002354D263|nr:YcxB family protein [Bacillus weihaiensis]
MRITYHLTEEDYLHFNLFHLKNSKAGRHALAIQRYLTPIMFIAIAFLFSSINDIPILFMLIPFAIMAIIWFLFYPKYFYHTVKKNAKKMLKEGKNDGIVGKHEMTLSEEGISDHHSTGETKVNWSGIQEFKEDSDYIYLYNSSVSSYIIPKRDLEEQEEFKAFIDENMTK